MMMRNTLAFAACMTVAVFSFAGNAQSTTGNIMGEATAGDTIYVTNADTGFKREMKIKKDGKYQVRNLPAGTYQLIPMHADGSFESSQQLDVRSGGTSRAMPPSKSAEANTP